VTRVLFSRQLRTLAPLLFGAACGAMIFEIFMVWISNSVDMGPDFELLLEAVVPPAMLRLILNQFGMTSFVSAVAFGFKHPLVLVAAVSVVITAASVPAAERETGLLDLIVARPVPRQRYLAAHVLLLLFIALVFPLALLAGAATGIAITGRGDEAAWTTYMAAAAALTPLLLLIGAYTLWFGAGARRRGSAIAPAIGLTLAFYMYEVLASMWQRLEPYEWATVFYFFAPVGQVTGEAGAREPLILLALAVGVFALAFYRFAQQQL
jgi:ABC-2 type transport system permease protein